MKLSDKLWNWGHLEGSHNKCTWLDCSMTPEQYAEEYGIRNSFIVSYGGNIQPPFNPYAKRFSGLREVKFSVLGDASSPLPEAELGNTEDILAALGDADNITGAIVDDFFSPKRMDRFTPEVLKKIKAALNAKGLDFWCVLYAHQLDLDLEKYMDCFDGVTFWIWRSTELKDNVQYVERIKAIVKNKPLMLGVYVWDYGGGGKPLSAELFETQLSYYFDLLRKKDIEGVVFCSNTLGDAPLATNRILKDYIKRYGDEEIPD
ncbi:MAG: hypothetical protein IKC32_05360 [Clostridia bacterium]|nr:hypothetical protein [Clostridia bacterium]